MTTEGEAQRAARRIARVFDHPLSERLLDMGDVETCARYILLSLAPGKDVVEGARAVMREITPCEYACGTSDKCECADRISAFATAHAAREREACAKLAESYSVPSELGLANVHAIAASIRARTP